MEMYKCDRACYQVYDRVDNRVREGVRDQVWWQAGDQVWGQVVAMAHDQVHGQVWDVHSQVCDQVKSQQVR